MDSNTRRNWIIISIGALLIYGLGGALVPLLVAFTLAYLFFPLIIKMEHRGIARHWAIMGVFSLLAVAGVLIAIVLIPKLYADALSLLKEWPNVATKTLFWIEETSVTLGYPLDLSQWRTGAWLSKIVSTISMGTLKGLTASLKGVFSNALHGLMAFLNLCLIPLFFVYLVNDYENIIKKLRSHIPSSKVPVVDSYFKKINEILSGYIRGQLLVALILAALYGIGLSLVGLKFGFLVGVLTGVLGMIPYVGFTIGFLLSISLALVHYSGPGLFIGLASVFLIIQTLESFIITPRLVGNKVGLSELSTILALIIGGNLLGLAGMLIAIPSAAILKLFIKDLKPIH